MSVVGTRKGSSQFLSFDSFIDGISLVVRTRTLITEPSMSGALGSDFRDVGSRSPRLTCSLNRETALKSFFRLTNKRHVAAIHFSQ